MASLTAGMESPHSRNSAPFARLRFRPYLCLLLASILSVWGCSKLPTDKLISEFESEPVFWQQFEIGKKIASVASIEDISSLEPWLAHKDRRLRGNAAYIFAKLGDRRGNEVLRNILQDNSTERTVHIEEMLFSQLSVGDEKADRESLEALRRSPEAIQRQIAADRYYAAHLFGELRDRSAVEILIPILDDDEVNYGVTWALGEIGDSRAIPPLIAALSHRDAVVRVSAINALKKLRAVQAIPALESLSNDPEIPHAGDQVPVGKVAREAAEFIRDSLATQP